jgi:zinc protease
MATVAALFPPAHPYSWLTIGAAEDLRAATLDEAHEFFRIFYHPRNASLALAGDIDVPAALALAEQYFGEIAPGPEPVRVRAAQSALDGEVRLLLEDRVELPRLYLAWHSPALFAPGDAEMVILSTALANGKTSRLYRALVYDRRIATDVVAAQSSRELSGFFQLVATAAPGHDLQELDTAISEEIDRLIASGPTADELERGLAQAEAHFVYRLQTVGGFGGKSDQLNAYNVFLDDPGYFERDLSRYRELTLERLQAAAARHLPRGRRVTLSVVPRGRAGLAVPGSGPVVVS